MKTIVTIINGIHLPYHVINYAIEKAKQESYEIHALFLKAKKEQKRGYFFPSDLGSAETVSSNDEALSADEKIIDDNMVLVREMVENEKISYRETLKTNASIEDIKKVAGPADLIVVDEDFDEMSLLKDNNISLKDLKNKISIPVHTVSDRNL